MADRVLTIETILTSVGPGSAAGEEMFLPSEAGRNSRRQLRRAPEQDGNDELEAGVEEPQHEVDRLA